MKRSLLFLLSFSFFLSLLYPIQVNALEYGSNKRVTRDEAKLRATEKTEERKELMSERRKEIITGFFARMMTRFQAASDRLSKLIERIEARIAKIEEENPTQNLTSQKNKVEDAKEKLDLVKVDMQDLEDKFEELLTSEDPKGEFETLKLDIKEVKDGLKEVHALLVKVITEIKGLRIYKSPSPSPVATP